MSFAARTSDLRFVTDKMPFGLNDKGALYDTDLMADLMRLCSNEW